MDSQQMISPPPRVRGNTDDALVRCIEACGEQACIAGADACPGADMVSRRQP